ncbi:GntR family transcriptional regulator [Asanoa iriomotensis]|uniref:GntR family transcriptional regulator n=1 Tax=Asanoa iriomotensis TaxID=234613 RepID=A0ABQ4BYZ1_9ACTN|nr:GntR family transcriptional regulator [Asanoa iriomotensis]GIF55738.1 GntR family transcriptional regulator [Asanoa iriomotensis]
MSDVALPSYQRIRHVLRQELERGALVPGDRMPTERELVERFGVAHMTVRHAIDGLVRDGLVVRRRGSGTFVVRTRPMARSATRLQSFSDELGGAVVGGRVIRQQEIRPDRDVAEALAMSWNGRVVELVRVRTVDGTPASLQQVFIPFKFAPGLARDDLTDRSLYQYLAEAGVTLDRAEQRMFAVAAQDWHAELLGVPISTPLLAAERLSRDPENHPVELARTWSHPDLSVWVEMNR